MTIEEMLNKLHNVASKPAAKQIIAKQILEQTTKSRLQKKV